MLRLREIRKSKKLTMKELGKIVGVSESTISLYENGKREPDIGTLSALCIALDVTMDYMTGTEQKGSESERNPTDDEIKFALFGGTEGTNIDEAWDDVKGFVQFIRQKYNLSGKGDDKGDSK